MPNSEKNHNEQVARIMREKLYKWQPKEGSPGVEICYRKGKLVVRRCDAPSTVVELSTPEGSDR